MTTAILLILSGVLIGTGIGLIWRDVRKKRRDEFVLPRDSQAGPEPQPDLEISVSRRAVAPPSLDSKLPPEPEGASGRSSARSSALPKQWSALQSVIGDAVEQVNAVLAAAGVAVGSSGEPSWSLAQGYGAYRRILVAGESLAWLRLELDADGELQASVKAHKDDLAQLNTGASAPAKRLTTARASDLLSECLKPAAAYAVQAVGGEGGGSNAQQASEAGWKTVDAVVVASLKAANGALAQAGARLMPLTLPTWDPQVGHHRMAVAVEVLGHDVARMYIDKLAEEMEVAVGLPEAHLADLGRRRRIPVKGMTTHALAELIASCAWPAIARTREAQGQA